MSLQDAGSKAVANAHPEAIHGGSTSDPRIERACRWSSKYAGNVVTILSVDGERLRVNGVGGRPRTMRVTSLKVNYTFLDYGSTEPEPVAVAGSQMATVTIKMTPEIAAAFRVSQEINRDISRRNLANIKTDMESGKYELTHQSMAFDKQGHLIDGQHRCLACEETCVTVHQRVTYYPGSPIAALVESATAQETTDLRIGGPIDNGARRGIAGQLQIGDRERRLTKAMWMRVEALSKAIRFTLANVDSYGASKTVVPAMSEAIVEDTYSKYQKEFDWVASRTTNKFNANVGAVVALAFGVWPEHMERFVGQLVSGENIPTNGPAGRLRDEMKNFKRSGGSQARLRMILMTANAVHLFVNGRGAKHITRVRHDAVFDLLQARKEAGKL